jgi:hypothetical protein
MAAESFLLALALLWFSISLEEQFEQDTNSRMNLHVVPKWFHWPL